MTGFTNIRFAGKFRTYQQAVLDRANTHLRDGHIHIVAAPGSGKTILGLELVRRLGSPALILAPSVTIRRQWGERFAESFLPAGSTEADYVSEDLHTPQLLTCVTYQALHAAMQKAALKAEADPEGAETEAAQDFTGFDLMQTVRQCGISTICLDEAHHLRREWQRSLEQFLQALNGKARIIALTATPPYDSTGAEWDNYIRVCGEVDEEIFVPQLVAQKTLCPHQDYLYFNPPTEDEAEILRAHRLHALAAAREITESGLLPQLQTAAEHCDLAQKDADAARALSLAADGRDVCLPTLQTALSGILAHRDDFPKEQTEALCAVLARNAVLEKGKVCLASSEKTEKTLLASAGKIESIQAIMASESAILGEEPRALILTDHIRKERIGQVGSAEPLSVLGAVPIFEAVRRTVGARVPIALLSGTLVLLPNIALDAAAETAKQYGVDFDSTPLPNAPYSEVHFAGSNKNKVSVVTALFQKGVVRALVGTAALLGEGWDAPCINTLILASCVGSFMLTNQMRGRAIRVDKTKPDKASDIWHLVTADPEETAANDPGADFAVMRRRFDGFLAPDYETPRVESGIDRLHLPKQPYTANVMQQINGQMLERSRDRQGMVRLWTDALAGGTPQVLDVCEVPNDAFSSLPAKRQMLRSVLWAAVCAVLVLLPTVFTKVLAVVPLIPALVSFSRRRKLRQPDGFFRETAKALLRITGDKRIAQAPPDDVFTLDMPERGAVYVAVRNASQHDKMRFARTLGTLFSAIEDPRYIFIPGGTQYEDALAVPAPFDRKKEDAQQFADCLRPLFGKGVCVYTRGQKEQKTAQQCRASAAVNRKNCKAQYKKIVIT